MQISIIEYRKKKANSSIAKIRYFKHPNLVAAINNRYKNYNDSVERIIDMENKKEIFVIRPSKHINIKRIEKDESKLQEMYDLGISDCKKILNNLKDYLS